MANAKVFAIPVIFFSFLALGLPITDWPRLVDQWLQTIGVTSK